MVGFVGFVGQGVGSVGLSLNKGVGGIDRLILAGDDGYAVDFLTGDMRVNYASTPAKAFLGNFASKLFVNGVLTAGPDGIAIDATNFARMATADWPYNPSAITVAGQIQFATTLDPAVRNVLGIDGGGNDALTVFVGAGDDNMILYCGFGASQGNTVAISAFAAGQWFDFVASAGPSGCFIAINGIVEATRTEALAANPTPFAFNGIGAVPGTTGAQANALPMKGRVRNLVVLARAVEPAAVPGGLPFAVNPYAVATLGDSHTFNGSWLTLAQYYTHLVAARLGRRWLPRNFGVSGDTTAQMFNRVAATVRYGAPRVAVAYGGTNDSSGTTTVSASPTPTSTVFTVASNIGRHAVNGWIRVAGEQAQVSSISGSQITLASPLAAGAPATGAAVTIDTQKNLEAIVAYWQAQGVTRIAVMGQHFWNFASGSGDTVATPRASLVNLRSAQAAAASSTGAVFIDLYQAFRARIVDGTYAEGNDLAWHVAVGDTHLNAVGQSLIADALSATIAAQGWA